MSALNWSDVLVYISGLAGGFLACWYWLVRPMAKVLGWEGAMRPPTTREWMEQRPVVPAVLSPPTPEGDAGA